MTGATGPQGPAGPAGATGPAGTAPNVSLAIFGVGPITIYTGNGYVVEATFADTIQLRNTASSAYLNWNITYPTNCISGTPASSTPASVHRFSATAGETLIGTLCNIGSAMDITAWNDGDPQAALLRCWRNADNAIACQKLF
jgi:hypothetical protein